MKTKDLLFAMVSLQKRIVELEAENLALHEALHEMYQETGSYDFDESTECVCDE